MDISKIKFIQCTASLAVTRTTRGTSREIIISEIGTWIFEKYMMVVKFGLLT